jgi:hypothetical protein
MTVGSFPALRIPVRQSSGTIVREGLIIRENRSGQHAKVVSFASDEVLGDGPLLEDLSTLLLSTSAKLWNQKSSAVSAIALPDTTTGIMLFERCICEIAAASALFQP